MSESRRARIAVVGTGWWSTYTHIPGLLENPDAQLVALCDPDEAKLNEAADRYGIARRYRDVAELLRTEALDGVVVAVNHTAHYAVARACLNAGLPIMLEKPMVLTAEDAHDLVERAKQRGVEIIVGYPWHYTATAQRAREIVQSGALGPIQYVSSVFASMVVEFYRGNPEAYRPVFQYPVTGPTARTYSDKQLAGGGQGHLQVTHSAGLLFWVTGLRAARVSAYMANFDVPVDLVDAISVRFESGALGTVGSSGNIGVGQPDRHDLAVYCANGYVLLDMSGGTLVIRRHGGEEERLGPLTPDDRYPRFATAGNLVDLILGRDTNRSPGHVAARCVELVDAAYRSAEKDGEPVSIAS
jgi:predicted dehydrogenase